MGSNRSGTHTRNGEYFRDGQWWSRTRWSSHAVTGWRSAHPRLNTTAIKWYEPPKCTKVREAQGWWPFRRESSGRVFSWVTPRRRHSSIGTYLLFHQYLFIIFTKITNSMITDDRYQSIIYDWTTESNIFYIIPIICKSYFIFTSLLYLHQSTLFNIIKV